MRIRGLILCAGLFAVLSAAKLKVFISVDVSDERIKSEIKAGIAARFNSTERYAATEGSIGSNIFLHVICISVTNYLACAADSVYYPFKNSLSYPLAEASSMATESHENLQRMISVVHKNSIQRFSAHCNILIALLDRLGFILLNIADFKDVRDG